MKKIYLLVLTAIVSLSVTAQVTISNSGNTWNPDSVHVDVGESIDISFGGTHDFKQIEEDHYRASGAFVSGEITQNGFSFDNASGGGSLTGDFRMMIPGKYYYTCEPHYAGGMRGIIIVDHAAPIVACSELFFSEYMEGSSNNKAVEIYNPTSGAINLADYTVVMYNNGGNAWNEFPLTGSLATGATFVLSNSSASVAGIADATNNSVMNHNGDDAIVLYKNGVGAVDIIGYLDNDPGTEFSLTGGTTANNTLVRMPSINAGTTDWAVSSNQWNVLASDSDSGFGAHTMTPCGGTLDTFVSFQTTAAMVNESVTTYDITVTLNQAATGSVDVVLTSANGVGINGYSAQTVNFAGTTSETVTITWTDDAIEEADEMFTFELQNMSSNFMMGNNTSFTFTLSDDDAVATIEMIGNVTGVDAGGNPSSLGQLVTLEGIVNSPDRGFNALEFSFQDATGGIGFYSNQAPYSTMTIDVGDEVRVTGEIGDYNGVTQIVEITELTILSTGNTVTEQVVTDVVESIESELIRINGLTLVDPSQWVADNGADPAGFTVEAMDASSNIINIRFDRDYVDLHTSSATCGTFDVIGVATQIDPDSAYLENYMIMPRTLDDIIDTCTTVVNPSANTIADATMVDASGDPILFGSIITLKGIITSPDFRENQNSGTEFTFADETGGIWAYSSDSLLSFNPVVGDSVEVNGRIVGANGVTRIRIDNVTSLGTATPFTPTIVSGDLDESHEAELITIENLQLTGAWDVSGGSFNVSASNGTTTYDIRVDADRTELFGMTLSNETFNLTGVGSQFDQTDPRTEGYQIMPRFTSDIDFVSSINTIELTNLSIYPNPASDNVTVSFENTKNEIATVSVFNTVGSQVSTQAASLIAGKNNINIDVTDLSTGIYFVEIQLAAGKTTQLIAVK